MSIRALFLLLACLFAMPAWGQERERDVGKERRQREAREQESRSNESLKRENDRLGRDSDRIGRDSDRLTRDTDRLSRDSNTPAKEAARNGGWDLSSIKDDPERQRRVEQSLRDMELGKKNYERDFIIFENREKKLPEKPNGYYQEYTVKPPEGVKNRGSERLIKGQNGEIWYSRDHYQDKGGFTRLR
jgi:guanyl-specific ribonuclease Sa